MTRNVLVPAITFCVGVVTGACAHYIFIKKESDSLKEQLVDYKYMVDTYIYGPDEESDSPERDGLETSEDSFDDFECPIVDISLDVSDEGSNDKNENNKEYNGDFRLLKADDILRMVDSASGPSEEDNLESDYISINPDDFADDSNGFEKKTLTFLSLDESLIDEDEKLVDVFTEFGNEGKWLFDTFRDLHDLDNDNIVMYLRKEEEQIDYEIIWSDLGYIRDYLQYEDTSQS